VRNADIAERLAARSSQPVDIVFTGLRPGEKLAEDLLGQGEADYRPRHPLIQHASVPPLPPDQLAILDPAADADGLRQALARCAGRAHSGLAAALRQSGPAVPGEPPAEFDQVAGELV